MPLSVKDALLQRQANAESLKRDRLNDIITMIDAALVEPSGDGSANLTVSSLEEEEFILRTYIPLGYVVTVEQRTFERFVKVDYPPVATAPQ